MERMRRSVSFMASRPMAVRLAMERSTSESMMPSTADTSWPSMAHMADITAVATPDVSFMAQLGLAPSHIMPVRLAIMFFTVAAMRE